MPATADCSEFFVDENPFGEPKTNPFSVPCRVCRSSVDLKERPTIDAIAVCKNGHRNLIRAVPQEDWLLDK